MAVSTSATPIVTFEAMLLNPRGQRDRGDRDQLEDAQRQGQRRPAAGPAPTRKARAAATRQRITESARALFLEQGYAATTMPAVATAAGVAVQTVYFTFRTEGDLLQAVYEQVVLGPRGVPPHLMPWWPAADDGYGIEASVRRLTSGTAELLTRAAPLGLDGARRRDRPRRLRAQ